MLSRTLKIAMRAIVSNKIRSFLTIISMSCSVEYSLEEIMALGVTMALFPLCVGEYFHSAK